MIPRFLNTSLCRMLDEQPSSVREVILGSLTKPERAPLPAEVAASRPTIRGVGWWLRKLAWLPFFVLAGALLLTGWLPALFLGVALLLPALAPVPLVLLSVLMSTGET